MKFVKGALCVQCGAEHAPLPQLTTCRQCGGVLEILYDYKAIAAAVNKRKLADRRDHTMWRYREFLPIAEKSIAAGFLNDGLRVGGSPLYPARTLAGKLGLAALFIKDDGLNPTASLKDRASALAVVKAIEAGASTIACSSTGNAASSLAGSAAAKGLKSFIFVPARAPQGKVAQLLMFGARVISVQGSYEDAFRLSAAAIGRWGWYNRNAAVNPYLSEGKKTVSFEIAQELHWQVPDYVAVSVGDGCTLAGVWKGFKDLYETGLTNRLPRLISVQAAGCCPINKAVEAGREELIPMEENTLADSIAVGVPRNFLKAVRAIKESKGITVNVSDQEILDAMALLGKTQGVFGEPAGVAGTAGLIQALAAKRIPAGATVVSIVTGNGLKDIAAAINAAGQPLLLPPDMERLAGELQRAGWLP